ncbi:MAG: hypothetical protein ABIO94_13200 [Opitutaceae bacterium]
MINFCKLAVALIALLMGGWLTFDGTRAFITGDYVTPKSGPHAGQLGPWSAVFSTIGIDPRSTPAKAIHVIVGACWLAALGLFFMKSPIGWYALAASSVLSLWYLPIGTALGVVELILLFLPQLKRFA